MRIRDALLREMAELEADLALAAAENERLRKMHATQRRATAERGALPIGREDLLRLIQRHLLPTEKQSAPPPSRMWLDAAMNPIAWLPFGNPSGRKLPVAQAEEEELEDLPAPKSHHPPCTWQPKKSCPSCRPLPPFSFTSTIVVLPTDEPGAPLLQKHIIGVRSATPPGLFTARIEMTVNAKHLAITKLAVPRLDPAAIGELGPFVEGVLRRPSSSATTRNVGLVTWAMAEWFRLAVGRARFWALLDAELGSEQDLVKSVVRTRGGKSRKRRRKGDDEEDAEEADEGGEPADEAAKRGSMGSAAAPCRPHGADVGRHRHASQGRRVVVVAAGAVGDRV